MIGSQSLVSTVGHTFALHSVDFLTIGLLVLWALSPLGGQSALRLVHETNSTMLENRSVFYADVDAPSEFPNESYNEDAFNRANAVLITSLMTADTLENSTVDTWNHPKIPRLEALEQAEEGNETARKWYAVDRSANYTYASLTGINVIHLSTTGSSNFTVPYEYMYLGCGLSPHNDIRLRYDSTTNTYGQPFTMSRSILKYLNGLNDANVLESGDGFAKNTSQLGAPLNVPGTVVSSYRSFFIYTRMGNTTDRSMKPEALIYGSSSYSTAEFWLFECSLKSVLVEANIICDRNNCGVERLRRLDRSRSDRRFDSLPYDVVHDAYVNKYLIRHLAAVGGENSMMKPNPVDAYIYGNGAWALNEDGSTQSKWWHTYVNNTEKTIQMSRRMTRFLNTFWDASRWPTSMTRNDPFAKSSLNNITGLPHAMLLMNATEAVVTRRIIIYRANAGWIASLVICSCVLLLLGIYSLFLSLRITVPDIFDYVSSFTRDNPYISAPAGGSALDGAERARLLRRLPVQLGDVDCSGETGYVALRSVNGKKDCELGQVRRDRMYR
ncbi:hypothetical protein NX059_009901 [Plenodomus lindquistii]|nr:hypothetical protein NX059_009901 [Plenodomus lindquistii]